MLGELYDGEFESMEYNGRMDACMSRETIESMNRRNDYVISRDKAINWYRKKLIDIFHNSNHDELMSLIVPPSERDFRFLESMLGMREEQAWYPWNVIAQLPSVTPKQRTGHWIRQTDDYHDYYECEHCGIAVGLDDIKNYCPNCGAKMESEEQE